MSYDNPRFGRRASGEEVREIIEGLEEFVLAAPCEGLKSEARRIIELVRGSEISPEMASRYLSALYDEADRRRNELSVMPKLDPDQFWPRLQAANHAEVTPTTVDNWRRRGLLQTHWQEGRAYINKDELESLIKRIASSWRLKPGRKTIGKP